MKEIKLTQGKTTLVDDEDLEYLLQFKWYVSFNKVSKRWVAQRHNIKNGKRKMVYMHREIMNAPDKLFVDHRNHDTLDNRKQNLRICTKTENAINRKGACINSTSKYLGVSWNKNNNKWETYIAKNSKKIFLGFFNNEEKAAIIRDKVAIQLHGDYVSLNFPELFFNGAI